MYRSFSSLVNLFLGNFLNFVLYLFIILCLVAQSCPALCHPMDCRPPGSSVSGDSPGKNTGVGCHSLLQGIFPTQGSNPGLPHCRWILYRLSHQGRHLWEHPYCAGGKTRSLIHIQNMILTPVPAPGQVLQQIQPVLTKTIHLYSTAGS